METPPLGISPRYLHDEQRCGQLAGAISRYVEAGYQLPSEWVEEYNELVERLAKHRPMTGALAGLAAPDGRDVTKAYAEGQ